MKNIETLNQEIKKLEEQKTSFLNLEQDLKDTRSDIYVREQQALSDILLPFFEGLNPDVYIEIRRDSIYFKMDHPDYTYRKELFNLYLRETYLGEGVKYNGVDVSYYTTSTKGENIWELKRLRLLGDVADILIKNIPPRGSLFEISYKDKEDNFVFVIKKPEKQAKISN